MEAAVASAKKPKLLDRVRSDLRVKRYSIRTEKAYIDWIRRFILFHGKRHPSEMGEQEISAFLTHLAVDRNVAASTQNQAFCALLFLYQQVLQRKLDFIDEVARVKRPAKIPVVFTREEARAVLDQLVGEYRLMSELLYGSGLRLMECVRLRVKDIDFGYGHITIRDGKGLRERVTILPERLRRPLHLHLGGSQGASRSRCRERGWSSLSSLCFATQISECCASMGMAICLPSGEGFNRPSLKRNPPPSYRREKSSERGETGNPARRRCKSRQLSHVPTQLRHTSTGKRLRHPHCAGTPRPQRRFYDHDLHSRVEQTGAGHSQSSGRGTARPPKSSDFPVRRNFFV